MRCEEGTSFLWWEGRAGEGKPGALAAGEQPGRCSEPPGAVSPAPGGRALPFHVKSASSRRSAVVIRRGEGLATAKCDAVAAGKCSVHPGHSERPLLLPQGLLGGPSIPLPWPPVSIKGPPPPSPVFPSSLVATITARNDAYFCLFPPSVSSPGKEGPGGQTSLVGESSLPVADVTPLCTCSAF